MGVYIYVTKPKWEKSVLLDTGERAVVSCYYYAYKPFLGGDVTRENLKFRRKYVTPCVMAFARQSKKPHALGIMVPSGWQPREPLDPAYSDRVFVTRGDITVVDDSIGNATWPIHARLVREPDYVEVGSRDALPKAYGPLEQVEMPL